MAERQSSAEEKIRGLELKLEEAQKQKDEEVGNNKLQGHWRAVLVNRVCSSEQQITGALACSAS